MKISSLVLFAVLLTISNFSFAQQNSFTVHFPLNECIGIDDMTALNKLIGKEGQVSFEVIGYTDQVGSESYNLKLSKCRADYVGDYLTKTFGDRVISIDAKGAGELVSNDGEIEPKNRKVDISWKVKLPVAVKKEPAKAVVKEVVAEIKEDVIAIDSNTKENIVVEGLEFMPGRHYPLPESRPALEKLFNTLKQNPTLEIEIQGFICCDYTVKDGFDNDTQEPFLSRNRAKFVYNYLVTEGINSDRLSYKGYGSTRPKVFPEASPEDEQANRRVEIKVTKF